MGEIVTKEDFWQIILNDTSQFGQITTEDEEFNEMSSFVWTVVQNTLVNAEDDNYIKSYEDMIGISGEGLTQYQRKVNILYMLSTKNYLALNLVKRGLINMGLTEFEVEHIKEENKVVVHTDRLDDAMLATVDELLARVLPQNIEVVQYNHNIEVSWRDINTFANVATVEDMFAICPTKTDFNKFLTSDGEFCYPMPKANGIFSMYSTMNYFRDNGSLRKLNLYVPKDNLHYQCFTNNWNLTEAYVYSETNLDAGVQFRGCTKLKKLRYITKGSILWKQFCENNTSLEEVEIVVKENSNLNFDQAFNGCILNKKSALGVLRQMYKPTSFIHGVKTATIGIHVDHQNDTEVLDAIANAEANGWSMEVQWNGTPTAQASVTYGLRKPPIYARVAEEERPDGTIERVLNWGHYVTNSEGYQEFSSLEEAYEHFGLEKTNI